MELEATDIIAAGKDVIVPMSLFPKSRNFKATSLLTATIKALGARCVASLLLDRQPWTAMSAVIVVTNLISAKFVARHSRIVVN
jgi:hypothetical protein